MSKRIFKSLLITLLGMNAVFAAVKNASQEKCYTYMPIEYAQYKYHSAKEEYQRWGDVFIIMPANADVELVLSSLIKDDRFCVKGSVMSTSDVGGKVVFLAYKAYKENYSDENNASSNKEDAEK